MGFPTKLDFLDVFGMTPVEEDATMAFCRYSRISNDGRLEIDFSFSAVEASFQVVLRCADYEVATISSERVHRMEFFNDDTGAGIRVAFELADSTSEALVTFEPELRCHWWLLRS